MYIENMYINNFRDGPENLRRLVSWPQTVEHLVLESGFLSSEDLHASWGLRELTPVIACQKENLRTLVIGRVPCDGMGLSGFSITDFPNLEELRLSRWSTGSLVAEQANLLAPQLRKFIWCFDFGGDIDGMGCDISDFGEWEENWLWNLMKTAVKQKACLSHVHLYFCPEPKWHSELSGIVFPWDRIDALREEFRHAGIKVTCQSDPKWYKHLWDRTRPGYKIPDSPPQTPPPAPDAHLPDPETDSESLVSLDGENQANKITLYFRPLPLRRRSW